MDRSVICRQWRGWTTRNDAARYQALLSDDIMPAFLARAIDGFLGYQAMERDIVGPDGSEETEHSVQIWFRSVEAIKAFAGEPYQRANVPETARALLKRWDDTAVHYSVFSELRSGVQK